MGRGDQEMWYSDWYKRTSEIACDKNILYGETMKESIHYQQVRYHQDDPNYTSQQQAQHEQEILPALDLIQDPRILDIFADPSMRIHTIAYEETLGDEPEVQSIDQTFG